MRPDSEPAAGSITALIRVGLPESMAALTARLSSSGDVADAGLLHLDDVRAKPGEELRARRSRLHVREIQYAHPIKRLTHGPNLSTFTVVGPSAARRPRAIV